MLNAKTLFDTNARANTVNCWHGVNLLTRANFMQIESELELAYKTSHRNAPFF